MAGWGVRDRLMALDARVSRREVVDLSVAPPPWQPSDGVLRPALLDRRQRVAVCSAAALCVTLGVTGLVTAPTAVYGESVRAPLFFVVLPLFSLFLGARIGAQRRGRPPALRVVGREVPVAEPRAFRVRLAAELVLTGATAVELAAGAPRAAFVCLLPVALVLALADAPMHARWSRVEAANNGRVLRLPGRHARLSGTSRLYFLPTTVVAPAPARRPVAVDAGNPYRSL